jgi:hypothetical protein
MRNQCGCEPVTRRINDSSDQWYKGYADEQFICFTNDGWYVESREGEFGPFENLKDAEDFYYERFKHIDIKTKQSH